MAEWWRERLDESEAFLAELHAKDRISARKRLEERGVDSLSDYHCQLLGIDKYAMLREAKAAAEAENEKRQKVTAALRPKGIVFRTAYLEELNSHAIDLAVQHDIRVVRQAADLGGSASQETRTIHVPAVTNETTYALCLHEIGHVVEPAADSRQYKYTIEEMSSGSRALIAAGGEVGAWKFAIANAHRGWTRQMQDELFRGLEWYSKRATADERELFCACVTRGALLITDKPWTFAELDKHRDDLRG